MNSGDMATVRKSQALPKWPFLAAVTTYNNFLTFEKYKKKQLNNDGPYENHYSKINILKLIILK